jgi:hypothetical protein
MFIDRLVKTEHEPQRGEMWESLDEPGHDPHSAPTERRYFFGRDFCDLPVPRPESGLRARLG